MLRHCCAARSATHRSTETFAVRCGHRARRHCDGSSGIAQRHWDGSMRAWGEGPLGWIESFDGVQATSCFKSWPLPLLSILPNASSSTCRTSSFADAAAAPSLLTSVAPSAGFAVYGATIHSSSLGDFGSRPPWRAWGILVLGRREGPGGFRF